MTIKPPADKLPLAVRRNIRDEYENKKAEFEQQVSNILGTAWSFDINPNAIWPYAQDSFSKERTGSCIVSYIEGAISRLQEFVSKYGDDGKKEINDICHAHQLTIDFDESKTVYYSGVDVHNGQLRILFADGQLGTNTPYALEKLDDALNNAPAAATTNPPLSYAARTSIRLDWDSKIDEVAKKIADQLQMPNIKLLPNWDDNFQKLKSAEKRARLRSDWQSRLGDFFRQYFESLAYTLEYEKFGDDDMLREGFAEAVDRAEVQLRVVDKLDGKGSSYNECVVRGGVLYLQTTPETWDCNLGDVATKLVDAL